jgi:hypothetical protein
MINNTITGDKRINELGDDTSRLAFTWLITFADREGRTHGDPAMIRSMLFPRRIDIAIERMEAYIQEWHNAGLIVWYEACGDKWIWFVRFEENQIGLRKEREPDSEIPPHNSEETKKSKRKSSGIHPADIRDSSGLREQNRTEEKRKADKPPIPIDSPEKLSQQVRVFMESGGKFPSGKLVDGTSRRDAAIRFIENAVKDTPDSLTLWAKVVSGYCIQWSPKSYTVMVNEYYLRDRIPGVSNGQGRVRQTEPIIPRPTRILR